MAAPKRSDIQIEKDREQIARWSLRGWSLRKIARELNLSKSQIEYDIKAIKNQWHKDTAIAIDEHKEKVLAELAEVRNEAWLAWERSQNDFKTQTATLQSKTKKKIDPVTGEEKEETKPVPINQVIHTENRFGDPRFLDQVNKCIERRCKLLGLDAPQKQEHTGKDGGPIVVDQFKGWTTEEVARYAITGIKPADTK